MRHRLIGAGIALALTSSGLACGTRPSPSGVESASDASPPHLEHDGESHHHEGFAEEVSIFAVASEGGVPKPLAGAAGLEHDAEEHDGGYEKPEEEEVDEEQQVDNPIWSPDGRSIAFTRTACEYCAPDLFLMRADGSQPRQIGDIRNVFQPSWAPDGQRLAVLLPGRRSTLYSLDIRSGEKQLLRRDDATIEGRSWSSSGDRIAFARQVTATNWDLYSITTSGRLRRLT